MLSHYNDAPQKVRVAVLGPLKIEALPQSHAITLSSQSRRLLACLSVGDQSTPRQTLIGLLYPETTTDHARRMLADALYHLRRDLADAGAPEDCLVSSADALEFNSERVHVDLHEFTRLCNSREPSDWLQAIDLYRGPLLSDFDEEWITDPQSQLQAQYVDALQRACEWLMRSGKPAEALRYTRLWTRTDPLNEVAHRARMSAHAQLGQHAVALQYFDQLVQLLQRELGVAPHPDTRALANALRREMDAATATTQRPAGSAFIGRKHERVVLFEALNQVQRGKGSLVLVEGDPGIGKTRLLDELAASAAWRGVAVARGGGNPHGVLPFAPLVPALQSAVTALRAEQLRTLLPPSRLHALAKVLPNLATVVREVTAANGVDLKQALTDGVHAMCAISPHVLLLDDVQWADAAFWTTMSRLCHSIRETRLLVVLAYRSEELRADAQAWQALREVEAQVHTQRLMLSGLSQDECAELAQALGNYDLSDESVAALRAHTGGNPLFIREVIAAGDAGSSPEAQQSSSLHKLIAQRLARVASPARAALEAAAVLDNSIRFLHWQGMVGHDLLSRIPELLQSRLMIETETGYQFQHNFVRNHIYDEMQPERRRELHALAAGLLQGEGAKPGLLAWHYEQAGQASDALRHHVEAGDQAESVFAHLSALQHYNHALALLNHANRESTPNTAPRSLDHGQLLDILCRRQRVFSMMRQMVEWEADVHEIERLARALNRPDALLQALEAHITLHSFKSDFDRAESVAHQALELARHLNDRIAEARIASTVGIQLVNAAGRARRGLTHLRRAARIAAQHQDLRQLMMTLCSLAFAERITGQARVAQERCTRAQALIALHPELDAARGPVLQQAAMTQLELAEWEPARQNMEDAIRLTTQAEGVKASLHAVYFNFALINCGLGLPDEAITAVEHSLEALREAGFADDSPEPMWSQALRAQIHLEYDQLQEAEAVLDGMSGWIERADDGRPLLYALTARGQFHLARGQHAQALADLRRAVRLWKKGQTIVIMPLLLHAQAAHRLGDAAGAKRSLDLAAACLRHSDSARFHVPHFFTRYQVLGEVKALQAAHGELQRQATLIQDGPLCEAFLQAPALHRAVIEAWNKYKHATRTIAQVRLARCDAPLGKTLGDDHYINVAWTTHAGEEDARILQTEGAVALRRHQLQRLLSEAHEQGAAPTDADLATALGVTRRTVERYMAALKRAGQSVTATRRRAHSNGLSQMSE